MYKLPTLRESGYLFPRRTLVVPKSERRLKNCLYERLYVGPGHFEDSDQEDAYENEKMIQRETRRMIASAKAAAKAEAKEQLRKADTTEAE